MKKPYLTTSITSINDTPRFDGQTVRSQVFYGQSEVGLATARNIVAAKLRNTRGILTNYRQSCARSGDATSMIFYRAQATLKRLQYESRASSNIRQLFLLEARAAAVYWKTVKILCKQPSSWHRIHPGADDPLNLLLNVGYTLLARICQKELGAAGLLSSIGIMHGQNTVEPLVYDLAEVFRQSAVDAVIFPLFSRKQKMRTRLPRRDMKTGFLALHQRYEHRFLYKDQCEIVTTIIRRESINLRRAILENVPWVPYRHPWRHGRTCSSKI